MICVSSLVLKSNPTSMVRPRSLKTSKTPDDLPQYFRVNETDKIGLLFIHCFLYSSSRNVNTSSCLPIFF